MKNKSTAITTTENVSRSYPKWHDIVAGATAGAGARLLTAPLDLIKIRRQVGTGNQKSLIETATSIYRNEGGIRALFRGNVAATYLWVGYAIVQFSLYGKMNELLSYQQPPPTLTQQTSSPLPSMVVSSPESKFQTHLHSFRKELSQKQTTVAFISGATAGICATLCTYPFDICRSAFAAQGLQAGASSTLAPTSMISFTRDIIQKQGLRRGLFAGCAPAIIQIIPYMGLNFALYDTFLRLGNTGSDSKKLGISNAALAGTFAGGLSKTIVYPLDTVKKRIQAEAFRFEQGAASTNIYNGSTVRCFKETAQTEGIKGFYKGMVPSVLKNAVATGITFSIFTTTKQTLETIHDHKININQR